MDSLLWLVMLQHLLTALKGPILLTILPSELYTTILVYSVSVITLTKIPTHQALNKCTSILKAILFPLSFPPPPSVPQRKHRTRSSSHARDHSVTMGLVSVKTTMSRCWMTLTKVPAITHSNGTLLTVTLYQLSPFPAHHCRLVVY